MSIRPDAVFPISVTTIIFPPLLLLESPPYITVFPPLEMPAPTTPTSDPLPSLIEAPLFIAISPDDSGETALLINRLPDLEPLLALLT
jgi:hypothetical protein